GYGEVTHAEVGDPGDVETKLTLRYVTDAFGHVVKTSADDGFGHHRSACIAYDGEQIFPYASRNAAGHTTYTRFDPGLGVLKAAVDPNGLVTQWAHDAFGRTTEEVAPDGTTTTMTLLREKGGGPQGTWWRLLTDIVAQAG